MDNVPTDCSLDQVGPVPVSLKYSYSCLRDFVGYGYLVDLTFHVS